jgi:hypothetical protein
MGVLGDKCLLNVGLPYVEGNDSKPVDFFDFPLLQFSYHRVWLLDRKPCSIVWLNSTKKGDNKMCQHGGHLPKSIGHVGSILPSLILPSYV